MTMDLEVLQFWIYGCLVAMIVIATLLILVFKDKTNPITVARGCSYILIYLAFVEWLIIYRLTRFEGIITKALLIVTIVCAIWLFYLATFKPQQLKKGRCNYA